MGWGVNGLTPRQLLETNKTWSFSTTHSHSVLVTYWRAWLWMCKVPWVCWLLMFWDTVSSSACYMHFLLSRYTSVFTGNLMFPYSLFQNKCTTSVQHRKLALFSFNNKHTWLGLGKKNRVWLKNLTECEHRSLRWKSVFVGPKHHPSRLLHSDICRLNLCPCSTLPPMPPGAIKL